MDYSFLSSLKVTEEKKRKERTVKEKNPKGLAIRVYPSGKTYPSEELVRTFGLEYQHKSENEAGYPGLGFDIMDSKEYQPLSGFERMIMFGAVSKTEPKVDLYAQTRYNEDGTPMSSVMTQGTPNEKLLNLCYEMGYLTDNTEYVDLVFVDGHPFTTTNGIMYVPKVVERGPDAGNKTYIKREYIKFYAVKAEPKMYENDEVTESTSTQTNLFTN